MFAFAFEFASGASCETFAPSVPASVPKESSLRLSRLPDTSIARLPLGATYVLEPSAKDRNESDEPADPKL